MKPIEKKVCSIKGCEKPYFGKGFCSMHYGRARRGVKDMRPEALPKKNNPIKCKIDDCPDNAMAKGFCLPHWSKDYHRRRAAQGG